MKNPANQPFNKDLATTNANHKRGKNLESRIVDYKKMVDQPKIGDGKRGPEGYTCPGSNKK